MSISEPNPADPPSVSPRVPRLAFAQPAASDGAAFEAFRCHCASQFTIRAEPHQVAAFFFDMVAYQLPHALVLCANGGAFANRRGPDEIARDPAPVIILHLQLTGECRVHCGDRHFTLTPGDVVFYDYARPLESTNEPFSILTVMIARERAPAALMRPDAHGAVLRAGSGAARLVQGTLEALVAALEGGTSLSVTQADAAVGHVGELAASLLLQQLAEQLGGFAGPGSPSLQDALAFIEAHLSDPGLNPGRVQAHLGISRSGLYRLFAPVGGVEAAIRNRRLDRAMWRILTARAMPGVTGMEGFANEAQFARTFAVRFGVRPGQLRERVQGQDRAWLTAQAQRAGFSSLAAWIEALAQAQK